MTNDPLEKLNSAVDTLQKGLQLRHSDAVSDMASLPATIPFARVGVILPVKSRVQERIEQMNAVPEFKPKSKRGGARPNSGPKTSEAKLIQRGHQQAMEDWINEQMVITVNDPKTGRQVKIKKGRMLVMLEKLYLLGMHKDNVEALKAALNRVLGMPKQSVGGVEDAPFKLQIDITRILDKAYGDK